MSTNELNLNEILMLRREKLNGLIEEGKNPYIIEKYDVKHTSEYVREHYDELEEKLTSVAGRIVSRRGHGKINFMHIQDFDGKIQIFSKKDVLGDNYEDIKKLDIGDIIGVEGYVFKTNTEEISIRATKVTLLSKSLQILPELFFLCFCYPADSGTDFTSSSHFLRLWLFFWVRPLIIPSS